MFSAFLLCMSCFEFEKLWNNAEMIALLCGFSLFVKLTQIFTMIVLFFVLGICCVYKGIKERLILRGLVKGMLCFVLVVLPSAVSLIHINYKTGNPLFPSYNGFFKSPYFAVENFRDPFQNKLSFSLQSLLDIVFNTVKNVEMAPYGMGIFLLFIFAIPFAILLLIIQREKLFVFLAWIGISLLSYVLSTVATYNLRYYFSVWILLLSVIVISISICIQFISWKWMRLLVAILLVFIILIPNIIFLYNNTQIWFRIRKDTRLVGQEHCAVLEFIPKGKKVLSITNSNQFKGDYVGYFTSTTWHNFIWQKVYNGQYSLEDYVSSFDYVLIDKMQTVMWGDLKIEDIISPMLGVCIGENEAAKVFEVLPKTEKIIQKELESDIVLKDGSFLLISEMDNKYNTYFFSQVIQTRESGKVDFCLQVLWLNIDGGLVEVLELPYSLDSKNRVYFSSAIHANPLAARVRIKIYPKKGSQNILAFGYSVQGLNSVVEMENEKYASRASLRTR